MSLGEAFVTARVDTTGFVSDAKAKLDAELAKFVVDVKVAADLTLAKTALTAFRLSQAGKPLDITVRLDNIAGVAAQLDEVSKTRDAHIIATTNKLDAVEVPVTTNDRILKDQVAEIAGYYKAHPLQIKTNFDFAQLDARIAELELTGIRVNIRPAPRGLIAFRKLVNDGLAKLAAIDVKLRADVPAFLKKLNTELNHKDADPVNVKLKASTAAIRTLIQQQFDRETFKIRVETVGGSAHTGPVASGRGFTDPIAEQRLSDAIERTTVSLREQAAAFRAAGASESEALSHIRRDIEALRAEAKKLKVRVPVETNSIEALAKLEASVERAKNKPISVPIKLDLASLRAQLAALGPQDAITIPIKANTEVLRGQLAAFSNLNPIDVEVNATSESILVMRGKVQAFFAGERAIDIEFHPVVRGAGSLAALRTAAGKIAAVKVQAHIEPEEFRNQLIDAGRAGIKVKIEPTGYADFKKNIEAYFAAKPALIHVKLASVKQFRDDVEAATETVKARVHIEPASLSTFRESIATSLSGAAALGVNLRIGNPAEFRTAVRALLDRDYPINIRPVLSAGALAGAGSAGSRAATQLGVPFRAAVADIAKEFQKLPRSFDEAVAHFGRTSEAAATALRAEFGLAAGTVAVQFDRAGEKIATALNAASVSGEKSLIRLARVGAATAAELRRVLSLAAAQAAKEIQGPLRASLDVVIEDLVKLNAEGRLAFRDFGTAGRLAAENIAASFDFAGQDVSGAIAAAAASMAASLKAATDSGITGIVQLQAVAAVAAKKIQSDFAKIAIEAAAAAAAAKAAAAKIAGAPLANKTARGALLNGFGLEDFKRIQSELRGLSGTGATSLGNIERAARAAAAALLRDMGDATKITRENFDRTSAEIAAALRRAMRSGEKDFATLAAAAAAAAAKIRADFAAADEALLKSRLLGAGGAGGGFFKRAGSDLDAFVHRARGAEAELGSLFSRIGSSLDRSVVNVLTNLPKVALVATVGVAAAFTALDATIAGFGIKAASTFQEAFVALNAFNTAKVSVELNKAADDADVVGESFKRTTAQVAELKKLALDTAFDFPTLADGVRQLQLLEGASGKALFSFKGATAVIETLGDAIATATGKIDPAKLQEVLLPISQAAASGKFLGNDLNQLAQRLPGVFNRKKLLSGLRDELKLTTDEFEKLKEGTLEGSKLPFERTLKVILENLRDVPGAAGAARRAVDKTLSGQFASFKEGLQQSLAGVFDSLLDPLSKRLPIIEAQLSRAFQTIGPGISKLVLNVVDSLATVIPALLKAAVAFNTAFGGLFTTAGDGLAGLLAGLAAVLPSIAGFFKQIADNIAPAVPAAKAIAVAIASLSAGALLVISEIIGDLGRNLAGPAELFKEIAGLLFTIARSDAGKVLAEVAAALITIKTLTAVSAILKAIATGLFSVGAGGAAAGAGLFTFRAGLTAALGPIALLVSSILLVNEALSKVGLTLSAAGIGKDIKGFFGGIADGLINATQATGNFFSKLANTVPGIHIDTTEFNNKLDAANDKIISVNQQLKNIDGTVATADVQIRITTLKTEFEKKQTGSSIFTKPLLDKEPAFSLTDSQQQSRAIDKQLAALSAGFTKSLGSGGGGAGGGGGKSAAETLADRIKAAKDKILESLVDFGNTVRTGSAKEIDTAFKSLRKSLQTIPNFDESGLVKKLRADNAKLDVLAKQRDALTKRIEDRTSKFNEIFDSLRGGAADAASTLTAAQKELTDAQAEASTATGDAALSAAQRVKAAQDALRALGVTVVPTIAKVATQIKLGLGVLFQVSSPINKAADSGALAFKAVLDKRVADLKAFLAEINDLKAKGLSPELLNQLVSAGAGSDLANQLKGASGAAVAGLNKTQAELDKVAAAIAGNGAVISEQAEAAATAAGKAVADGLVAGLKQNRDKLQTEINLLVKAVIKEVRKALGIKSPSRVMAAIAKHIPTGLAKGIGDNLHHVKGAVSDMVSQVAATSFAPISLPDLNSKSLTDAQARLNTLSLPKLNTNQELALRAPDQGVQRMHRDDLAALTSALQQTRVGHTYNTPIHNMTIGAAPADPAAFAAALNGAVSGSQR